MIENHTLVVVFEDEYIDIQIQCGHTGDDRPCASYSEGTWPNEVACRCEDPECPCRDGEHGECADFGYVDDMGPACRCVPNDECWYTHAVSEVGWRDALSFDRMEMAVSVKLTGCSFDEPIEVAFDQDHARALQWMAWGRRLENWSRGWADDAPPHHWDTEALAAWVMTGKTP